MWVGWLLLLIEISMLLLHILVQINKCRVWFKSSPHFGMLIMRNLICEVGNVFVNKVVYLLICYFVIPI